MSLLVSGEQLAELAGVSAVTIRRYARGGAIPAVVSPGGHRKYDPDLALRALAELRSRLAMRAAIDPEVALEDGPGDLADPFDVPPTPRGAFLIAPALITIREAPTPSAPVMTSAEWETFVEAADGHY